uniref:ATP synthase mitochondrial F1 complex assembly factor 2 n=1 Tax=Bionectria ochroleuca TaxID=29856 RepID=A0A8H7NKJ6_BIOOC
MMKPPTRIPLRFAPRLFQIPAPVRLIHSTTTRTANVDPLVGTGPPPEAPTTSGYQRVERRRRQAELLKAARDIRNGKSKSTALKKRFWDDVYVKEVDGALQVHLDERPLRHPLTKEIVRLPLSKGYLAAALAVEWDNLTSVQEATKQHLIPLTSLVCRAIDIQTDDASDTPEASKIRTAIATTVMKYLDTDSLLCWAPPAGPFDLKNDAGESLRDVQKKTADSIVSFLTTNTWPGVKIEPVSDGHSIVPQQQSEGVREVVHGWVMGLDAWEITALERAVLAGKSFLAAARLVVEWSEGAARASDLATVGTFGADEAAKATNLEVDWQAGQWGEVEDTHDVNNEDVRRQLGSAVLLVSGDGKY